MTPDRIPLTQLPRELSRLTGRAVPGYRALYLAAVDGRLPADQGTNGRWGVPRADLPKVADALGLTARTPTAA